MFIQTEQTPNPATLKFLPGQTVMETGSADFPNPETAIGKSPLAETLFAVEGVTAIFFGADFITVTKMDDVEWYVLKPSVLGSIMEHFAAARPVMSSDAGVDAGQTLEQKYDVADEEIVLQIKELLDTRVRPAVAQDGGDIVFHGFEAGVVYLAMRGACAGCPSATATLKMGIENMLRHYIPEVTEVRPAE